MAKILESKGNAGDKMAMRYDSISAVHKRGKSIDIYFVGGHECFTLNFDRTEDCENYYVDILTAMDES